VTEPASPNTTSPEHGVPERIDPLKELRVRQSRDQVGSAWSRCGEHNASLTRYAGKSLGSVDRTLLMTDQNMIDLIGVVIQGIVHRHDRTTRIAKYRVSPFFHQATQ
jgi:hypothetical protein